MISPYGEKLGKNKKKIEKNKKGGKNMEATKFPGQLFLVSLITE